MAVTALGLGAFPESASSFDRKDATGWACAGLSTISLLRWRFVDGTAVWTTDEKVLFTDAINRWGLLRNSSGGLVADATYDVAGPVRVIRNASDGTFSNTACVNGTPELRIHSPAATIANPGSIVGSSSHEAGHAHGLDHAGDDESQMYGGAVQPARVPRMSGCDEGSNPVSGYPESDDWAQLVAKANGPNLPTGVYNPDSGFETYENAANVYGASDPRSAPAEVWAGVKSVLNPASGDAYVAVGLIGAVATPLQQVIRIDSPPTGFRLSVRYKMSSTAVGGNFKLRYRRISYPAGQPSCGNAWSSSFNVNQPSWANNGNWVIAANNSVSGSPVWMNSPVWIAPAQPSQPLGQSVDVQLLATNGNAAVGDLLVDSFVGLMS